MTSVRALLAIVLCGLALTARAPAPAQAAGAVSFRHSCQVQRAGHQETVIFQSDDSWAAQTCAGLGSADITSPWTHTITPPAYPWVLVCQYIHSPAVRGRHGYPGHPAVWFSALWGGTNGLAVDRMLSVLDTSGAWFGPQDCDAFAHHLHVQTVTD